MLAETLPAKVATHHRQARKTGNGLPCLYRQSHVNVNLRAALGHMAEQDGHSPGG
jgi:hypothetical protein